MEKGFLIVMEGACDGIGKSTQFKKLSAALKDSGYKVVSHHFPSYGTIGGAPVEEYLAGNFGDKAELSPYFINTLYATDRACIWLTKLKKEYEKGKIILLDRYTTSSIIYQSSLIPNWRDRKKFIDYVVDYEYNKIGIASPDMVIFLDAPFDLVTKQRKNRVDYEGNSGDIHEKDIEFMHKVYDNSREIAKYLNWDIVDCGDNDKMKSKDEIHEDVLKRVLTKLK